jgi:hypothetical protein
MYSVVLMMAMTTGAEAPDCFRGCHGCNGCSGYSCGGGIVSTGCSGCFGGGCHGGGLFGGHGG